DEAQRTRTRVDVAHFDLAAEGHRGGTEAHGDGPLVGAAFQALGDLRAGHAARPGLDVLPELPGHVRRARQRKRLLELDLHWSWLRYRLWIPSALHCCHTR